jgi:hypothetical protein
MANVAALVGTWKMISWTRKVVATGEVSDAMGADPIGYIVYHADGRMMALVFNRSRPILAGPSPNDVEKIGLFDTMLAYTASYTLEDGKVVHHVDAAWNPAWMTDLIRWRVIWAPPITRSRVAPSQTFPVRLSPSRRPRYPRLGLNNAI